MERRYHWNDLLGDHHAVLAVRDDGRACLRVDRSPGGTLLHRSYWRAVAGLLEAWPLLGTSSGGSTRLVSEEAPDERVLLSEREIGMGNRAQRGCMVFSGGTDRPHRNVVLPVSILWAVAVDLRGLAEGRPLPGSPSTHGTFPVDLSEALFAARD